MYQLIFLGILAVYTYSNVGSIVFQQYINPNSIRGSWSLGVWIFHGSWIDSWEVWINMIMVIIIVALLFLLVGIGVWQTFGSGKTELRDPIDEHSKMHELGIAHKHQ